MPRFSNPYSFLSPGAAEVYIYMWSINRKHAPSLARIRNTLGLTAPGHGLI